MNAKIARMEDASRPAHRHNPVGGARDSRRASSSGGGDAMVSAQMVVGEAIHARATDEGLRAGF